MSAQLFQQWLDFATEDLIVARLVFEEGHFAHTCFLSQQCIEKALKAVLIAKVNQYPRIHNLTDLLTQCIAIDGSFSQFVADCVTVDQYYIPTRYPVGVPGSFMSGPPTNLHAMKAIDAAERILQYAMSKV
ncbi:MAG: HEPN domain-containing protein [Caldilineaceae bacterium]